MIQLDFTINHIQTAKCKQITYHYGNLKLSKHLFISPQRLISYNIIIRQLTHNIRILTSHSFVQLLEETVKSLLDLCIFIGFKFMHKIRGLVE